MTGTICLVCGDPLPPRASTGRVRRYCSQRCRVAAYRERNEGGFEPLPGPSSIAADDLAALDSLVDDANSAPPEDRLARAVLETRNLSHGFRQIAGEVRPSLKWRASGMASALDRAVEQHFGGTDE